ncbi:DUF6157 family protein [Fodinibius salsisoli]|uniref:Uncharacterized protein n=1 Tax=Fodinibius salsisoli TaxID=2820877 RepID=A0ABT3PIB7_9BACT|nr:DUF6157 family protein [Fodinibius salsisoli]MCW9705640.1 hypothetical protein [Fodinibius salsisoli]
MIDAVLSVPGTTFTDKSQLDLDVMGTTNYFNTFIEVAEDCPVDKAEVPPERSRKTKVRMQYELISENPYEYTSDDLIFHIYAKRHNISDSQREVEREAYFSKGRACLRSSSIGKRYGWGIHYDEDGKMALYGVESEKYDELAKDKNLDHLKAMRSSRS